MLRVGPMSGFRGGNPPVVPPFRTIVVTNQSELNSALASLQAKDRILVDPGTYTIDVTGLNPLEEVTITANDGDNWPEFTTIKMTSCSRFHFQYFAVINDGVAYGGTEDIMLYFLSCSDIRITGIYGDGGATEYYASPAVKGARFCQLESCTRVTIDGECEPTVSGPGEVQGCSWGFRIISCTFIILRNYRITDCQYDAVFVGPTVSDIQILNNMMGCQLSATYANNHQDGIQFYTTGASAASYNIEIRGNIIVEGARYAGQGIFMNDEGAKGFNNVVIAQNFVQSHRDNGISFRAVTGGLVEENLLVLAPNSVDNGGGVATPFLQTATGTTIPNSGVVVRNNRTPGLFNIPSTGVTLSGQVTSSDRSILPGIDAMTTLAEFEALVMPAGLGPVSMRA